MKAKEYFEKFIKTVPIEHITMEAITPALSEIIREMYSEFVEMMGYRKISTLAGFNGLVKEFNNKYNVVANMLEKHYGRKVLVEDGFKAKVEGFYNEISKEERIKEQQEQVIKLFFRDW